MSSLKFIPIALLCCSFSAQAEYAVGYFYLKNGQPERAYKEFRELAEVGYAFYMNMIADMHLRGEGVEADTVLAHVWYRLSAAQGNSEGIEASHRIEKQLTRQQLLRSDKLTHEFAERYLQPLVEGWTLD